MINIQKEIEACTYVIEQADDMENTWLCTCLDVDVVSQGDNPAHALAMAMECAEIIIEADRGDGRDPHERGKGIKMLWKSKRVHIEGIK